MNIIFKPVSLLFSVLKSPLFPRNVLLYSRLYSFLIFLMLSDPSLRPVLVSLTSRHSRCFTTVGKLSLCESLPLAGSFTSFCAVHRIVEFDIPVNSSKGK